MRIDAYLRKLLANPKKLKSLRFRFPETYGAGKGISVTNGEHLTYSYDFHKS